MNGVNTPPELTEPQSKGALTNSDILTGKRFPPQQVVRMFSSADFEEFTHEWAYGYLKDKGVYNSVFRYSGPNDKGRDVVAFVDAAKTICDYYQCKHYDSALSPSIAWLEIGKLCYFTFTGEIIFPRKYYFVAPRDVTSTLATLLHGSPDALRQGLIRNWKKCCEKKIKVGTTPLDEKLKDYIEKMDFSIFDFKPILEVIDEHSKTRWAAARFGGGLRPRPRMEDAPNTVAHAETRYVEQLLEAYSDRSGESITAADQLERKPTELEHFKRQRNAYYSAEALRIYARESLPPEYDEFGKLKTDVHDGVINTANRQHADGVERVDSVVDAAMQLPIEGNLLADQIHPRDKQGICHHLANEDKLTWVPKQKGKKS